MSEHASNSEKMIHAKSHPTVRINSKRFEQSPFAPAYRQEDTLLGCYCNRFYPISFGEDVITQYWKLRRGVMLFDVPEKPIEIRGPDAMTLLEKVFTRRIADLKQGRAHYAIACTPQGGILMDGVLIRLGEARFWYVQADGEFESWLIAHSDGLEVVIEDPQSRVLQIQGPKALAVLSAATSDVDEASGLTTVADLMSDFGYFHARTFNFAGQELLVTRTGWTGELGFEIYCESNTDHMALWEHLLVCGKPFGLENTALEVMGVRRVEAGILDNGTDIDRSMTPFDIGLARFVDFTKSDFVGKKALQHASRKMRLYGVVSDTGVPTVGSTVSDGQQQIGHIRVGDWSPTLEKGIGYVLFDTSVTDPAELLGEVLTLRDKDGTEHHCEVVNLPFYDDQKHLPRGLEYGD
ncbi:MAG: aminomethyltransferase family protein [Leucothrix sp.]